MTRYRLFATVVLAYLWFAAPPRARADVSEELTALAELRIEDAERALSALPAAEAATPAAAFARAELAFLRGRYDEAVAELAAAEAHASPELHQLIERRRGPIDGAARRTRGFQTMTSADGRYIVRFDPSDEPMAPYVLTQLAAADRTLTELLGFRHPGPIRVEIYADPEALSEVSTLSVQAIETTGTIAVCKFDRLMITSPRVLSLGYPWADTLAHELVHLLVARATRDRATTWFHEGIAKFLETAPYYGHPVLALDPAETRIFHERLQANDLLPFERFHPSVAMLPTPEDAALAYAEAATVVAAVYASLGKEGLSELLLRASTGEDTRVSIGALVGKPFEAWLSELWAREKRGEPGPRDAYVELPRFVRGRELPDDDASAVRSAPAQRHVRLGDMLWANEHPLAASREYQRARRLAPDDPVVLSRMGRSALAGGDARAALDAARAALRLHPDHAPARSLVASALLRTGDRHAAMLAAYDALRYNPFDPSPHCVLTEASDDPGTREREGRLCRSLAPAAPSPR